jgi:uncharacterized protein with NRDE domain
VLRLFSEGASIAVMEKYFGLGQFHEVWTSIDATKASQALSKILAEQGHQEATLGIDKCDDMLIEQSLVALGEHQQTGHGISHEAMQQWASELGN